MSKNYQVGPLSAKERIELLHTLKWFGWKGRAMNHDDEKYHAQYPYTILFPDTKSVGGKRVADTDCGYERLFSIDDAIRGVVVVHDDGSVHHKVKMDFQLNSSDVVVYHDKVVVGCTTVSREQIQKILDTMNELRLDK